MTNINRRKFLKSMGALGTAVAIPGTINFAAMTQALAGTTPTDYKALVCINLKGGNDHANTLVPHWRGNLTHYETYRTQIALTKTSNGYSNNEILGMRLPPTNDTALVYSLHPELKFFKQAFDTGKLAILQNAGTLKQLGTTRQLVKGQAMRDYLPDNLFSHNDQQSIWQTGSIESAHQPGWAGYIADEHGLNNTSISDIAKSLTTVSIDNKNALFMSENGSEYVLSHDGMTKFRSIEQGQGFSKYSNLDSDNHGINDIVQAMMKRNRNNIFENYISKTFTQSYDVHDLIGQVLNNEVNDQSSPVNMNFNSSYGLAEKLKMVAHLIHIREALGLKRQVFNVNLSGFDTHTGLLPRHNLLMKELNESVEQFYSTLETMALTSQVTTFTFSEMGRSFVNNSAGSDHGWGGHQFIIGGSVDGGTIYGQTPNYELESDDDFDQGRLIPSTSREQYIATLAKWFGVSDANMANIAPNIGKFAPADLGFMK